MTSLRAVVLNAALGWATAALAKVLAAVGSIAKATMYAASVLISSPRVSCNENGGTDIVVPGQYELEECLPSCAAEWSRIVS